MTPYIAPWLWNSRLHFMLFPNIGMAQVVEILPQSCKTMTYLFYMVNIMNADILVMQRARASATLIFTMLNRINSVWSHGSDDGTPGSLPAPWGLSSIYTRREIAGWVTGFTMTHCQKWLLHSYSCIHLIDTVWQHRQGKSLQQSWIIKSWWHRV